MISDKVMIFTDASRFGDGDESVTAYGWLAMDLMNPDSFVVAHCSMMEEFSHSTIHAEAQAIFTAIEHYKDAEEIHVFTDSLFVVDQWARERVGEKRHSQVYRDEINTIAMMENVFLHHVRAHKAYFHNEVVDKMVRFASFGEMTSDEAEDWARATCRAGVLEIRLSKDLSYKPRRVFLKNTKNRELHDKAMMTALTSVG